MPSQVPTPGTAASVFSAPRRGPSFIWAPNCPLLVALLSLLSAQPGPSVILHVVLASECPQSMATDQQVHIPECKFSLFNKISLQTPIFMELFLLHK